MACFLAAYVEWFNFQGDDLDLMIDAGAGGKAWFFVDEISVN